MLIGFFVYCRTISNDTDKMFNGTVYLCSISISIDNIVNVTIADILDDKDEKVDDMLQDKRH